MALTSLTVEEFSDLVEPFEVAFREHMAEWTLEGKRRLAWVDSQLAVG